MVRLGSRERGRRQHVALGRAQRGVGVGLARPLPRVDQKLLATPIDPLARAQRVLPHLVPAHPALEGGEVTRDAGVQPGLQLVTGQLVGPVVPVAPTPVEERGGERPPALLVGPAGNLAGGGEAGLDVVLRRLVDRPLQLRGQGSRPKVLGGRAEDPLVVAGGQARLEPGA